MAKKKTVKDKLNDFYWLSVVRFEDWGITWKRAGICGAVVLFVFCAGLVFSPSTVITKEVVVGCDTLRNKQGIIDFMYNKTKHLSLAQWETVVVTAYNHCDDPEMILAIVLYESMGALHFVSSAKAVGLGGILVENEKDLIKAGIIKSSYRELFEPVINIKATQFMFSQKYRMAGEKRPKMFRNWSRIAYTMRLYRGLNRTSKKALRKDLIELNKYTTKILNAYWELKKINQKSKPVPVI